MLKKTIFAAITLIITTFPSTVPQVFAAQNYPICTAIPNPTLLYILGLTTLPHRIVGVANSTIDTCMWKTPQGNISLTARQYHGLFDPAHNEEPVNTGAICKSTLIVSDKVVTISSPSCTKTGYIFGKLKEIYA